MGAPVIPDPARIVMYGAFVIDPDPARHPDQLAVAQSRLLGSAENAQWQEMVMVMNAFDTNFDGGNEIYAVNTIAFEHVRRPIPIKQGELVRIYLANFVEFDLMNSFHLHANMQATMLIMRSASSPNMTFRKRLPGFRCWSRNTTTSSMH